MAQAAVLDAQDTAFDAIVAAVNLARNFNIRSKADLHEAMLREGFSSQETDEAIATWSGYVRERGRGNLPERRPSGARSW